MKPAGLAIAFSLSATLLLAACVRTTYQDYAAPDDQAGLFERRVRFHLSSAYWRTPPRCVAIRTASTAAIPAAVRRAVAGAVERHLATRLVRVMGPARTRRAARRLGLDPDDPADRSVFARRTGCDAMIRVRIENLSDDYLLVWSRRAISISLEMTRSADGALLWKARHRAWRDDGGVPFSLFSAPFAAFRAARLSGDREVFESIADDAVRRMTATLPDLRAMAQPAFRWIESDALNPLPIAGEGGVRSAPGEGVAAGRRRKSLTTRRRATPHPNPLPQGERGTLMWGYLR